MKKLPKTWTTVTPFSKGLALFIFTVFPVIAYFLGRYAQQIVDRAEAPPLSVCVPPAKLK